MSEDSCGASGLPTLFGAVAASFVPWGVLYYGVPLKRGVSYLERALTYLQSSREGLVIEVFSAVFSAVSCGTYVAGTYLKENTPQWFHTSELAMSSYFAVYWLNQMLVATNRVQYFFGLQSFVDIVTATPIIVATLVGQCEIQFGVFAAARVMKFFRVLRLIRVLRSFEMLSSSSEDAIRAQTMRLFSIVAVILVVTTGFVQYLANDFEEEWRGVVQECFFDTQEDCLYECPDGSEDACPLVLEGEHNAGDGDRWRCWFTYAYTGKEARCTNAMNFHDSLYFTIVTFATVGYGYVVPVSPVSRISIFFMIGVTMWAVPHQLNKLQALKDLKTEHDGVFAKSSNRPHVILSCDPSVNVEQFIHEFFHEDHAMKALSSPQLVLLIDQDPTNELRRLLLKYATRQRLFYVRGDATSAMDLGRARVDEAVAIFLMADRSCDDHDGQDHLTVLRAFTAKRANPSLRVFAQDDSSAASTAAQETSHRHHHHLLKSERSSPQRNPASSTARGTMTTPMLASASRTARDGIMQPENEPLVLSAGVHKPDVMCMNQMRLSLLGASVAVPGLPTLLLNLVQSISWRQSIMALDWHEEYSEGMTMEIYSFRLKKDLVGMRFGELSRMLKDDANACLLAVASSDSVAVLDKMPSKKMLRARSKRQVQAVKKAVARKGSVSTQERVRGVVFNPGTSYQLREEDTVFVIADEAKRLEKYERFDEAHPNPSKVHPWGESMRSMSFKSANRESSAHVASPDVSPAGRRPLPSPVGATGGNGGGVVRARPSESTEAGSEEQGPERRVSGITEGLGNGSQRKGSEECEDVNERPGAAAAGDAYAEGNGGGVGGREESRVQGGSGLEEGGGEGKVNGGGDGHSVKDEGGVRRAMHQLVESVEDTFGPGSRNVADNISAYLQFQLTELQHVEREMAAARRPLRSYLVHKLPSTVQDHIIVVCSTMDDMQYLVRPIYFASRGQPPPIVFITEQFPTAREWDEANLYQEVWVMINKNDSHQAMELCLERAGLLRAACLLCCCDMSRLSRSVQDADAKVMQAVLVAHSLAEFYKDLVMITELTKGGFSRRVRGVGHTSSIMQHVLRKSMRGGEGLHAHNQAAGIDINSALDATMEANNLIQGFQHLEPAYVAGLTVTSSLLDLLVCQQYFNPHIITLMYHFLLGGGGGEEGASSNGYVIVSRPLPAEFAKRSFGELFEHLSVHEDTIAVGLYRLVKSSGGNQFYVVTNPRKTLELRATDSVYCIGPTNHPDSVAPSAQGSPIPAAR